MKPEIVGGIMLLLPVVWFLASIATHELNSIMLWFLRTPRKKIIYTSLWIGYWSVALALFVFGSVDITAIRD